MKTLLGCAFLFLFASVSAQKESALENLQKIYSSQVAWEDAGELTYDKEARVIAVKNLRIPVAQSTLLKFDKKKGNKVIFAMQNNTAITDATDPAFKRASFEIPFNTKDGAVSFITYFNKLIAESKY
jgi:hypothetical protein